MSIYLNVKKYKNPTARINCHRNFKPIFICICSIVARTQNQSIDLSHINCATHTRQQNAPFETPLVYDFTLLISGFL